VTEPSAAVSGEVDGDVVRLAISGEIDLANAEEIEQAIAAHIDNRAMAAVVDLSQVTYIDSIGIRLFFHLARRLSTAQIELRVIAPPGCAARRVFEAAGLASTIELEPRS
jgi:anti-anti-sigma factor